MGFHCVRPDFDIVVPMYAPYTRKHLISPFTRPRNITVLLRFQVDKSDGKYLIANHGAAPAAGRPRAGRTRPGLQLGVKRARGLRFGLQGWLYAGCSWCHACLDRPARRQLATALCVL